MGGSLADMIGGPVFEAPWEIITAVNYALTVWSWHENLPEDEKPPRNIWWSEKLLDEWFDGVREARDAKNGKRSSYEKSDDVPMSESSLADQFRPVKVRG